MAPLNRDVRTGCGTVRAVSGVVVVSALLTAFSESFYWYPGGTDFAFRVVVYLVPTTALLWVVRTFPSRGVPIVILGGAVYGFVTEGVLTPVVYGGFPLDPFAISYTSLAWHALVSVGFGLILLHRLLARGSRLAAIATISAFGAFWGLWAMNLRLPPDADEELAGISALVGDVGIGTFALYTAAVTTAVALCHGLLGRVVRASDLVPRTAWTWTMVAAGGAWFAILVVPAVPWAPLQLAALLWVCRWGLLRASEGGDAVTPGAHGLLQTITETIPLSRLGMLAALPATATVTYAVLVDASLHDETVRLVFRDILIAVQTLAGWLAFGWALWRVRRDRDSGRPAPATRVPPGG